VEVHRELKVGTAFRKVDEIPFDFNRRRMSVGVEGRGEPHLLICKGAVEEVLAVCSRVRHGEVDEALSDELLTRIRQVTAAFNAEGLRVVAVAARSLPEGRDTYSLADEQQLTLIGYVAFLDPPKESTAPALKALAEHGVAVKVLTGDNELVTAKICREVGLAQQGLLMGNDIERMSDAQLAVAVENTNVFAKLTPTHKERIVRILKGNGHVVGFMGDGINDAPALRTADIGISVDSAVDIAKEAADIILLEKSLMVQEKEKLYLELKAILARQPGPEVAEQLTVYQQSLKTKTRQLKAMASELNMCQAQVNEYKYEIERLSRELQELKRKYYQQKRKDQMTKELEQEGMGGVMSRTAPQLLQNEQVVAAKSARTRYAGGGFAIAQPGKPQHG
jgi:phosphoserine phosphatase